MAELYGWVKNIIIFLILTTVITNLLGKSSYKKYIDLICGIILLILVITPILKLFKLSRTIDYYFSANYLLTETKEISNQFVTMEEGQIDIIMKEYKDKLIDQIESVLAKENLHIHTIQVFIDEDDNSPSFGQITGMDIRAGYLRSKKDEKEEAVEKVKINKIKIGEKTQSLEEKEQEILSPVEINAKKLLSDFYNMNPDNINISIQE